ncbi:hypothetical protein NW752_003194 [Fusarium irregulare]|uniref:Uncharacterized protein n=1 Tax=Fusarium irregulare TaxID=2494466 RepID=A0A9W8Q0L8_9HYPO|nr:hypothetical protein NW766_000869 [Fusarium irregulare]KAJ4025719.1 hypothetical protein NW752_003194 [Fusarium irregulare]
MTPVDMDSPRRRQAMNHYIKVLSELLSISLNNNSFLSDFLPLAMESPALAEALIAYSSGHMSYTDPSYTTVSLTARSKALKELSMTVSRPTTDSAVIETALSACLILLTSEVCLGSHQSWYNHLVGAKHLIACARSHKCGSTVRGAQALSLTSEGRWILRNFAYHDIIGSVTLGTQCLLNPDYLRDITDEFDTYLGVATQLLSFVAEITCLSFDTMNLLMKSKNSRTHLNIENDIKAWNCPVGASSTLEAVAYAYRGAALILLYRKMRVYLEAHNDAWLGYNISFETLEGNIQEVVANGLDHIKTVPENDVSESPLLFPLFILGGEVIYQEQMNLVLRRLEGSYGKRRFRNISRALEVLEELWISRQVQSVLGGKRADWEDILRSTEEPLLLT